MPEEVTISKEIEKSLDRQPFRRFWIVATSGDRYEVTGRHQVALGKQVIMMFAPDFTSIYLRTNQIVAVETGNGEHHRPSVSRRRS